MAIMGKFRIRFSSVWSARLMAAAILLLPVTAFAAPAAEKIAKIAVSPTAPYYIFIVYESLAVFWVAILGLLVILRMKLREIERIQALGLEKEDQDAPLLE
jgi:predicted cobalt transporter CbtA